MEIIAKRPSECTTDEVQEFISLIKEGAAVDSAGLTDRVKNAEILVFVRDRKLVGVGSVKNPNKNYKNRVFLKVGYEKEASKYDLEIGYFFILPSCRGKKLSSVVMKEINNFIIGKNCFATTRTNNEAMIHILEKSGFQKLGLEYPSEKGDHKLVLYTNIAH